jgi:hypothetical protein
MDQAEEWTLKQVQGDGIAGKGVTRSYEPEKGSLARFMRWFLIAVIAVTLVNLVIAYFLINNV